MGKRLTDVLKGAAAVGLFSGLAALTGRDLDPESLAIGCCDVLANWLSGRAGGDILGLLGDFKLAILIYGLVGSALLLWSILYCGKRGILVAACGYFGALFGIAGIRSGIGGMIPGLAVLAAGLVLALAMRDHGGRDLRRALKAAGLPVKKRR